MCTLRLCVNHTLSPLCEKKISAYSASPREKSLSLSLFARQNLSVYSAPLREIFLSLRYYFNFFTNPSLIASRNSSVYKKCSPCFTLLPWIHTARSFVIFPCSTVSIHTASSAFAKSINGWLPSSLPRNAKPLVHAKMDAIGFVEVGLPGDRGSDG